ncbi:amidase [uncultured Amphritea sp.]|uniref:amidase n=1 Tax=uncultured Amphritea sp. TaxID=981605 RepID=UPI002603DD7C|nr:amidase [uncultured Amphritea sp.]
MSIFSQRISQGGDGYLVAVKDTVDVQGLPTIAGCQALEGALPAQENADVVNAVLNAGCQLVGKTNLHELAYGMTGVNHWAGTPVNFYYPDLIPGGSSSGSAVAVAAGQADFAIGTDTGGSIRVPAACCGVYGLKPTFGRVSRRGVLPAETTLDSVGVFAASADMLITGMQAIDSTFTMPDALKNIRLGLVDVQADSLISETVTRLLERSGIEIERITLPFFADAFTAGMVVINAETWRACGHLLETGKVGEDVAQRLVNAANTTDDQLRDAEIVRKQFTHQVDEALQQVSALVLPTLPSFPMSLTDALAGKIDLSISALVRPFNLSGHPALSLPLETQNHRPVGLQLVGRKGEDEVLCELARFLSEYIPTQKKIAWSIEQ